MKEIREVAVAAVKDNEIKELSQKIATELASQVNETFQQVGTRLSSLEAQMGNLLEKTPSLSVDENKLAETVSQVVIQEMAQVHQPGFCGESDCEGCAEQRNQVVLETVNKIEEKVPGTRDALAAYEYRNQPIVIANG